MLLVVSGAAAVGFLSPVVMLWMGLHYMPVRDGQGMVRIDK